jgi:glycosyltransferase involved in cell wall biosynthesis
MKSNPVCFLLPGPGCRPVGGFKVVYEYAQGLSERGYPVSVMHAARIRPAAGVPARARARLGYARRLLTGYRPDRWFSFRAPVDLRFAPSLRPDAVGEAEVVVATSWETAEWLASARLPACRLRMYLIQHFESWSGEVDRVEATWKLPLRKVVISRWLAEIARSLGEEAVYIPNGLDFKAFGLDVPIAQRPAASVAMLHHEAGWKGSACGREALRMAHEEVPGLRAVLFGTCPRPRGLPSWCAYLRNPPQPRLRDLYNRSAIVLSPSLTEGWGLVGSEGMLCGAAFVGTDIGGHREYAEHGVNALLSPPGNPRALAESVVRLLRESRLRVRLAERGNLQIRRFRWEDSVERFLEAMTAPGPT